MKFQIALLASSLFMVSSARADLKLVKCVEGRPDLDCVSIADQDVKEIVKLKSGQDVRRLTASHYAQAASVINEYANVIEPGLDEEVTAQAEKCFQAFSQNADGSKKQFGDPGASLRCARALGTTGGKFPLDVKTMLEGYFYRLATAPMLKTICDANQLTGCPTKDDIAEGMNQVVAARKAKHNTRNAGDVGRATQAAQNSAKKDGELAAGSDKGTNSGKVKGGTKGRTITMANKLDLELTDNTSKNIPACILGATTHETAEGANSPCPTDGNSFPEIKGIDKASKDLMKIEAARSQIMKAANAYLSLLMAQRGVDKASLLAEAAKSMVNSCGDAEIKKTLEGMKNAAVGQLTELEAEDSPVKVTDVKDGYISDAVQAARQIAKLDDQIKAISSDFDEVPSNLSERWPAWAPCRSVLEIVDQYANAANTVGSQRACSNHQLAKAAEGRATNWAKKTDLFDTEVPANWTPGDEVLANWPAPQDTDEEGNPVERDRNKPWNGLVDQNMSAAKRCDTKAKILEGLASTRAKLMGQYPELGQLSPGVEPSAKVKRYAYQDIASQDEKGSAAAMRNHVSEGNNAKRLADLRTMIKEMCANPAEYGAKVFEDDGELKAFMDCTTGMDSDSTPQSWQAILSEEAKRCVEMRKMGALACAIRNEVRNTVGKKFDAARDVGLKVGGMYYDLQFCVTMTGGLMKGAAGLGKAALAGTLKEGAKELAINSAKSLASKGFWKKVGVGLAFQLPMIGGQGLSMYDSYQRGKFADAKYWAGLTTAERRDALKAELEHGGWELARDTLLFGVVGGLMHGNSGAHEGYMTPKLKAAYEKATSETATNVERQKFIDLSQARIAERMGLKVGDMKKFFNTMKFKNYKELARTEMNGELKAAAAAAKAELKVDPQGATAKLAKKAFGADFDPNEPVAANAGGAYRGEAPKGQVAPGKTADARVTPLDTSLGAYEMASGKSFAHSDPAVRDQHLVSAYMSTTPKEVLSLMDPKMAKEVVKEVDAAADRILDGREPGYRKGMKMTPELRLRAKNLAQNDLQAKYVVELKKLNPEAGELMEKRLLDADIRAAKEVKERGLKALEAEKVFHDAKAEVEAFEAYQIEKELEALGNKRSDIAKFLKKITESCFGSATGSIEASAINSIAKEFNIALRAGL